jgi:hypothetical protein
VQRGHKQAALDKTHRSLLATSISCKRGRCTQCLAVHLRSTASARASMVPQCAGVTSANVICIRTVAFSLCKAGVISQLGTTASYMHRAGTGVYIRIYECTLIYALYGIWSFGAYIWRISAEIYTPIYDFAMYAVNMPYTHAIPVYCVYTGVYSPYAGRHGASRVDSFDDQLAQGRTHAQITPHEPFKNDV